ncbi:hypothetical protein [Mycobacterium sp. SMC-4]|uniref:hypothetical protein n=1 Tax=Mycobacterium sp. SMC-4 TaxID=2857059 RepID=UPI0021B2F4D9|nr:hypothetical protein [Mycobacterium sp. SMC-4]
MSTVVERGHARCPRCVSVADYVFIEYGRGMRYEVCCRKCGERYAEESRPSVVVAPVSAPEPPIEWPPDHDPVPPRDRRAELRRRFSDAAGHARTGVDLLSRRVGTISGQARTWVRDHRHRSAAGQQVDADQTGG